jgi:hypothetical protein
MAWFLPTRTWRRYVVGGPQLSYVPGTRPPRGRVLCAGRLRAAPDATCRIHRAGNQRHTSIQCHPSRHAKCWQLFVGSGYWRSHSRCMMPSTSSRPESEKKTSGELDVGSARKRIEKPRKGLNERTRTHETDVSWLTKGQLDCAKGMKIALTRCVAGLPREIRGEIRTTHLTRRLLKS